MNDFVKQTKQALLVIAVTMLILVIGSAISQRLDAIRGYMFEEVQP